jgi:transcriptional regulator with XRE-family HTH domain
MYETLMGDRKVLVNNKSLPHRAMKSELRIKVGERFIAARELNGFSQTEAAIRIGYKSSAQLCLWEQGKRLPPIDQMIIASIVYGVSLDFLYSLSPEPERDPRDAHQRAMVRQMQDMLTANAQAVTSALLGHVRAGGTSMVTVRALHAKAEAAANAIRRFQEINRRKFESMPGSNTLMVSAAALEDCTREAMALLARHEGIKKRSNRSQEDRYQLTYPLFETPEYRQGQLGLSA